MAENDVTNLLREIDDSMRVERLQRLWQNFGSYIVGASVAILLGTVAWVIWNNYLESRHESATAQMVVAQGLELAGKYTEAAALYAQVAQEEPDARALAIIKQAQALANAGKQEEAEALLFAQTQKHGDEAWGDFARVQMAAVAKDDKAANEALRTASASGKPFSFTARELLAERLIREHKHKEARDMLTALAADPAAPPTLKQRAVDLLQWLDGKTVPASDAPKDAGKAP